MITIRRVDGRLVIVDPMPAFCESMAAALTRSSMQVVAWTTDEREAAALAERLQPDIVLTEIELDVGSGLGLARRLRDRTRVIVLTRTDVGEVLLDAASAGAVGCLGHGTNVSELVAYLLDPVPTFVHDHGELLTALRRTSALRAAPATARLETLTPREREVLRLLADGLDNEGIATRLSLSPNTVRTHVGRILRKLGIHTRAEATRMSLAAQAASGELESVTRISGPRLEPG
jgi:DNA-binding NarL/FixJ family response regulator